MLTLGIETSCDETSVAILRDGREILVNLIASQVEAHQLFGGVVPEIASRKHLEILNPLLATALRETNLSWREIDLVAVTHGPGLVGALLVGVASAKALAMAHEIPCLPVNHVEGHIVSTLLQNPDLEFPMLCLVVSGGHSDLILMRGIGDYTRLGRTRDDAAGEAFDKVARALKLPQPGGPNLEKAAREGDKKAFSFGVSKLEPSFDFSFSGLKTAGSQAMAKFPNRVPDIAASFQAAAVKQLKNTVERALIEYSNGGNSFAQNADARNAFAQSSHGQKSKKFADAHTLDAEKTNANVENAVAKNEIFAQSKSENANDENVVAQNGNLAQSNLEVAHGENAKLENFENCGSATVENTNRENAENLALSNVSSSRLSQNASAKSENFLPIRTLGLCGGVASNGAVRAALEEVAARFGLDFVVPPPILCTDNAAMIAAVGHYRFAQLSPEEREYSVAKLNFEAHSQLPVA